MVLPLPYYTSAKLPLCWAASLIQMSPPCGHSDSLAVVPRNPGPVIGPVFSFAPGGWKHQHVIQIQDDPDSQFPQNCHYGFVSLVSGFLLLQRWTSESSSTGVTSIDPEAQVLWAWQGASPFARSEQLQYQPPGVRLACSEGIYVW